MKKIKIDSIDSIEIVNGCKAFGYRYITKKSLLFGLVKIEAGISDGLQTRSFIKGLEVVDGIVWNKPKVVLKTSSESFTQYFDSYKGAAKYADSFEMSISAMFLTV